MKLAAPILRLSCRSEAVGVEPSEVEPLELRRRRKWSRRSFAVEEGWPSEMEGCRRRRASCIQEEGRCQNFMYAGEEWPPESFMHVGEIRRRGPPPSTPTPPHAAAKEGGRRVRRQGGPNRHRGEPPPSTPSRRAKPPPRRAAAIYALEPCRRRPRRKLCVLEKNALEKRLLERLCSREEVTGEYLHWKLCAPANSSTSAHGRPEVFHSEKTGAPPLREDVEGLRLPGRRRRSEVAGEDADGHEDSSHRQWREMAVDGKMSRKRWVWPLGGCVPEKWLLENTSAGSFVCRPAPLPLHTAGLSRLRRPDEDSDGLRLSEKTPTTEKTPITANGER